MKTFVFTLKNPVIIRCRIITFRTTFTSAYWILVHAGMGSTHICRVTSTSSQSLVLKTVESLRVRGLQARVTVESIKIKNLSNVFQATKWCLQRLQISSYSGFVENTAQIGWSNAPRAWWSRQST